MSDRSLRLVAALRAIANELGPGDLLGSPPRFEIGELIAEGGMGRVYYACDRETGREVAVKVVRVKTRQSALRFEREMQALASVNHPAIVRAIASGRSGESCWIAMDRLVGETLAHHLHRGSLGVLDTIALARRVAGGLAAAHRAGIAHRDIKPSNLFVPSGEVENAVIVDFGLARFEDGLSITTTGTSLGTPGYMAPEQVRGEPASTAADVFALGCVLFECLAGRSAFDAASTDLAVAKALLEEPSPLRSLRAEVPPSLEALVARMMDKDARRRPTMDVVDRELVSVAASWELPNQANIDVRALCDIELSIGDIAAGKYRVEERIGDGGMGIVLAARHVDLRKRVALKLLRNREPNDVARFLREARAAAQLESEHVSRVLDVGTLESGIPFIVMEHLSGRDLARVLVDEGPIPAPRAIRFVLDACDALAEAHQLGIVHRDLKPSNLFLVARRDGSELVKVLDFGISKITKPEPASSSAMNLTDATAVIGSAAYMSPEQLRSSKDVDARTDVWALGVVLYELLAGVRPFDGESPAAIGAAIVSTPARPLREVASDVSVELEGIVMRCLEKDPSRRIPSVAALVDALEAAPDSLFPRAPSAMRRGSRSESAESFARAEVGTSERPASERTRAKSSRRPSTVVFAGVAAFVAGIAVGASVLVPRVTRSLDREAEAPAGLAPSSPASALAAVQHPELGSPSVGRPLEPSAPIATVSSSRAVITTPSAFAADASAVPPPIASASAAAASSAVASRARAQAASGRQDLGRSRPAVTSPRARADAKSKSANDVDLRDPALEGR